MKWRLTKKNNMKKEQLDGLLKTNLEKREWWYQREIHAAWNDDGRGRHIDANKMIAKYDRRIELLKELIAAATF